MNIKTKKYFEEVLNEQGAPPHETRVKIHWNYGSWLRRNDPIAFNVGFNDFINDIEYREENGE